MARLQLVSRYFGIGRKNRSGNPGGTMETYGLGRILKGVKGGFSIAVVKFDEQLGLRAELAPEVCNLLIPLVGTVWSSPAHRRSHDGQAGMMGETDGKPVIGHEGEIFDILRHPKDFGDDPIIRIVQIKKLSVKILGLEQRPELKRDQRFRVAQRYWRVAIAFETSRQAAEVNRPFSEAPAARLVSVHLRTDLCRNDDTDRRCGGSQFAPWQITQGTKLDKDVSIDADSNAIC
ncbi:hypothetical protein GCM10011321_42470 [Youhaiella tibetensis]|nr:hypothetical protein GCM10011321_42470 [Youhaiella tibetensis]